MDKKNVLLKRFNLPDEDRVYKMHEIIYNYLRTFHDTDYLEEINHMKENVENTINSFHEAYDNRYNEVNKLLYSYWKVSKIDDKGVATPVMYVYPYKLLRTNCYVFTLCSFIKPEYNNNNGLHEESFDIMNHHLFKENNLLFEETTESEMMENAKKSCEDAMDERMWKLKYRDKLI